MSGKEVKGILRKNGYKLADVANAMGIIPQNLQSLLNVDDIKTGVLERIADAIGEKVFFFYWDRYGLSGEALENKIHQFSKEYVQQFVDVAAKVRAAESRANADQEQESHVKNYTESNNGDTSVLIGYLKEKDAKIEELLKVLTKYKTLYEEHPNENAGGGFPAASRAAGGE